VSEDEKCGISTQHKQQMQHITDGVLGGPWDCMLVTTLQLTKRHE